MKKLASLAPAALLLVLAMNGATAQAVKPLRIGVMTDLSGQFSHEAGPGAVTAVKMAVQDFGGSVLGRPIEVLVNDHQNKPDIAASKAREWLIPRTSR